MDGFRFGVNMTARGSRREWVDKCRAAEDLGYDVIAVADHLEIPAPFPAIVLAGETTSQPKLCPYVLNAPFYNPTLLAREVATAWDFTEGRLELGLGAGYVKAEFEEAGIPWQRAGLRLDHLERTLDALPEVPLLIGGWGDRTLRLAAKRADTISFTGASMVDNQPFLVSLEAFEERVRFVRETLSGRDAELNVLAQRAVVTEDRDSLLERFRPYSPELSREELGRLPTLLVGTAEQIADQIRGHRERLGLTYFTVLEQDLHGFGPVLELLKSS